MKASDPSAETWELGKLLTHTEDYTPKRSTSGESVSPAQQIQKTGVVSEERVSPESPPVEEKEKAIISPPAAASDLRILDLRGIEPISIIIKKLEELSDTAFLVRAQKYSYRYENSIYRWFLLLNRLYEEATSDDSSKGQETKTPGMKISKLTLPQVEELVSVNLPDISEAERLLKEASFTFPSIGVPLDITSTTLFVEIGLLLLTSYFWIWYREARVSRTFPASATLFGALARSASSRFMFSLLILLPPIAAALRGSAHCLA